MKNRIHIIGRKNSGKTTLILKMIEELQDRGLKVGTIKHTSHRHDPEPEGKDSRLQREAGANPSAIISDNLVGVYRKKEVGEDVYRGLHREFAQCDVVLVEGDHLANGKKIEVWRKDSGEDILARNVEGVEVIITEDKVDMLPPGIFVMKPDQVVELIHFVQELLR